MTIFFLNVILNLSLSKEGSKIDPLMVLILSTSGRIAVFIFSCLWVDRYGRRSSCDVGFGIKVMYGIKNMRNIFQVTYPCIDLLLCYGFVH